jgi:D-glucuronyl C5-epimerase-like protein
VTAAFPTRDRSTVERFLGGSLRFVLGERSDPAGVRGYPLDLRVKAPPEGPDLTIDPATRVWTRPMSRGLGSHERWLAGEGDQWLESAREMGDLLLREQRADGGWAHEFHYQTYDVRPPWISGMAQGMGASLLVRVHAATGEERYAEAAIRAIAPLERPASEGGAAAALDGALVPEEYPTDPPSLVLNGMIFGLWGLRDVAVGLDDSDARRSFGAAMEALAQNIGRWDLGWWSTYDLYPRGPRNVASMGYHELHCMQLSATNALVPSPALADAATRFTGYAASRVSQARAFMAKAAFRIAVPRSKRAAAVLPWARGRRG